VPRDGLARLGRRAPALARDPGERRALALSGLVFTAIAFGLAALSVGRGAPATAELAVQRIDVNSAPASRLRLLPRIGPTLAARIVADREANGPYEALGDLARVKRVGPRTVAGLRADAVAGGPASGDAGP